MINSLFHLSINPALEGGAPTGICTPECTGAPDSATSLNGCFYDVMEAKSVSKKLRFEVFKRDSFTCKYCGKSAPDVILHVDHIHPKSKGGGNNILNLITSCFDCNLGKSNRLLSDDTVVSKQREQATMLQERRDQIKMMAQWVSGLESVDNDKINSVVKIIADTGFALTDKGKSTLRKYVKEYEFIDVLTASHELVAWFFREQKRGKDDKDCFDEIFSKFGSIIKGVRLKRIDPNLSRAHYLKNYLRRRYNLPYNDNYIIGAIHDMILRYGVDYADSEVFSCKYQSQVKYLLENV